MLGNTDLLGSLGNADLLGGAHLLGGTFGVLGGLLAVFCRAHPFRGAHLFRGNLSVGENTRKLHVNLAKEEPETFACDLAAHSLGDRIPKLMKRHEPGVQA